MKIKLIDVCIMWISLNNDTLQYRPKPSTLIDRLSFINN